MSEYPLLMSPRAGVIRKVLGGGALPVHLPVVRQGYLLIPWKELYLSDWSCLVTEKETFLFYPVQTEELLDAEETSAKVPACYSFHASPQCTQAIHTASLTRENFEFYRT